MLPCKWRDFCSSSWEEASKWRHRHRRAWSLLEDQICCFCLYIRDFCRRSCPLYFDLSHSRAGISSMFSKVSLNLSKTYVIRTQMFYLSKTQGQATIRMINTFFDTPAASHLSMFTIFLSNLLLFSHNCLLWQGHSLWPLKGHGDPGTFLRTGRKQISLLSSSRPSGNDVGKSSPVSLTSDSTKVLGESPPEGSF